MHRQSALLVAFVLFIGSSAFFLQPAEAQGTGSASLSVYVCSADWGQASTQDCRGTGLPEASVNLHQDGPLPLGAADVDHTQSTDAWGSAYFSGLAEGDYTLTVTRAGFQQASRTISVAGDGKVALTLMGDSVTATGTVKDPGGAAVEGATVSFEGRDQVSARTDASGAFSVSLTAAQYNVRVSHPAQRTLYDYRLVDGQSSIDLVMEDAPERTASVHGTVTDQDGAPVVGATVQTWQYNDCCYAYETSASDDGMAVSEPAYYPYYDDNQQVATTDAQGQYTLALYPGYVNLYAFKDGYAGHSSDFQVEDQESRTEDFTMEKYPPKTAHITGRVVDAEDGSGLRYVSISVQSPRYGLYECSMDEADGADASGSKDQATIAPGEPYPGYNGCAITVNQDGSFEGDVTPGYSILSIHYQSYRDCTETQDADGSYVRTCGPEFFSYSRSLVLDADTTTDLGKIGLVQRPGADAVVQGWIVDADTGAAIPNAQISFSNQDTYSYGWATTDDDGSYKIRVRSGYHQVSVWAEGHFHWEGVVRVGADQTVEVNVPLTAGQDRYGGCCYYYGEGDVMVASDDGSAHVSGAPTASEGAQVSGASNDSGASSDDYEDLGGGLGKWSNDRSFYSGTPSEVKDTPMPWLLAPLALGLAVLVRRRSG